MRLALAALLVGLAAPPRAQIAVGADVSVGPSVTSLGSRGVVRAGGVALPLGEVSFPTSLGLDARARVEVRGATYGGRVGVGYLSASDVFDGASLLNQEGIDLRFVVASAEGTYRQPLQRGGVLVVGSAPRSGCSSTRGAPSAG